MKCLYCQKELVSKRKSAKFDSNNCRIAYFRREVSVTKIVPVTVTKTPVSVTDTVTEEVSVTSRQEEKKLLFTKDQSIKQRIKIYKEMYPDSMFVPNWIANGFLSKDDAMNRVINLVNKSVKVSNSGLRLGLD